MSINPVGLQQNIPKEHPTMNQIDRNMKTDDIKGAKPRFKIRALGQNLPHMSVEQQYYDRSLGTYDIPGTLSKDLRSVIYKPSSLQYDRSLLTNDINGAKSKMHIRDIKVDNQDLNHKINYQEHISRIPGNSLTGQMINIENSELKLRDIQNKNNRYHHDFQVDNKQQYQPIPSIKPDTKMFFRSPDDINLTNVDLPASDKFYNGNKILYKDKDIIYEKYKDQNKQNLQSIDQYWQNNQSQANSKNFTEKNGKRFGYYEKYPYDVLSNLQQNHESQNQPQQSQNLQLNYQEQTSQAPQKLQQQNQTEQVQQQQRSFSQQQNLVRNNHQKSQLDNQQNKKLSNNSSYQNFNLHPRSQNYHPLGLQNQMIFKNDEYFDLAKKKQNVNNRQFIDNTFNDVTKKQSYQTLINPYSSVPNINTIHDNMIYQRMPAGFYN